jgi:hypothetical protein
VFDDATTAAPAALLEAWDAGHTAPAVDRAPTLLRTLGLLPDGRSERDLTVGECDTLLRDLRRTLFGDLVELVGTCPACGTEVDADVSLMALAPDAARPAPEEVELTVDGYELTARLPRNEDLSWLAVLGDDVGSRDVLERCLLAAHDGDGRPVAARELPETVAERALGLLAEHDPGAQTRVAVRCPCGERWADELHIRSLLWDELTDWIGATLAEVDLLARAYGWREDEILALPAWRRSWYVEATGW